MSLYFTTAGVKCCVAAVKCWPVLHFSVGIFFWSFVIIDASTIKCWELSTAQAVLRGVSDVARIYYPSCTDSIKPSLQFSCNFIVINASEGSLCYQICFLNDTLLNYIYKSINNFSYAQDKSKQMNILMGNYSNIMQKMIIVVIAQQ
jgi:hypothetical protein